MRRHLVRIRFDPQWRWYNDVAALLIFSIAPPQLVQTLLMQADCILGSVAAYQLGSYLWGTVDEVAYLFPVTLKFGGDRQVPV